MSPVKNKSNSGGIAGPVLHVITGLGAGGAETMLVQLAIALQEQGLPQHVVILTNSGVHAETLLDAGVGVTRLEIGSFISLPRGLSKLAWLVWRLRPSVIQGWMYHGNLAATVVHGLVRKDTRLAWNIRASNMDAKRYGRVIRWNARWSARPDVVLNNSHASVEYHNGLGIRPRRLMVIHNGIDVAKYRPDPNKRAAVRKELGISQDAIVAALVARVDPMKDHTSFLDALSELPHVTGLLVGAGTQGLDLPVNVIALGLRQDVGRIHWAADLIVSSSVYGEGFSNALAEGMSSGLIPVSTDVGDARIIIGDAGRVVPPGSPEMLGAAIEADAALSPVARRRRGMAARQRIVDRFKLDRAVKRYAELYRDWE